MNSNITLPAMTGSPLARCDYLRADTEQLAKLSIQQNARILPMVKGSFLFETERLIISSPDDTMLKEASLIFLGMKEETPWFTASIPEPDAPEGVELVDLRTAVLSGNLSGNIAAIAGTAKALTNWHFLNPFCPRCGKPTSATNGGWRRDCGHCKAQHFPRTDPVVIMLLVNGERCAVARNVNFPPDLYSCIAGFVEPGESIEEAVRRESEEELGLRVSTVSYISSQPWPFPASLMLGCIAQTKDTQFTLEAAEIADAKWVTREELREIFDSQREDIAPPREGTIARALLLDWMERRIGF